MGFQVCSGALCQCSFGMAPSALMVLPDKRVMTTTPAATIMDSKPMVNVLPFGMCTSPANPGVIAALGAPVPCVPVTPAPWVVGAPTVLVGNVPALNNTSKLMCAYAGVIQVVVPGQFTTMIP
jgi:hypothetical protein